MLSKRRQRVVIHVDLDAFYCQVEQKRHGIPREIPCAVQQWDGLIAVNYAARAAGVTRHMRVAEAKKVCPQLRTVHVETIGEGGSLSPGLTQKGGGERGGGRGVAARRNEAKASLQPYRQASGEIMRVLAGLLGPGCLLEKASIDEAFLDVTPMVEEELHRMGTGATEPTGGQTVSHAATELTEEHLDAWGFLSGFEEYEGDEDGGNGNEDGDGGGRGRGRGGGKDDGAVGTSVTCGVLAKEARIAGGSGGAGLVGPSLSGEMLTEARRVCEASVIVGGPVDLLSETDRRLLAGAMIALRMRTAVRTELDFTCSAGIATNKLLAKVGSTRNKPDKQTVVLPRGVPDLMQDMPLGKLRGLGGKLGASLEQHFGATNAGHVQQLPLEQLQRVLGERTGLWVSQIVRGQCTEPIIPKDKPKSLLSCKSFEPTRDLEELHRWLGILAEELAQRCREDEATHRRRARTLVLHYRGVGPRERSVRCPMPQHGKEGPSSAVIAKASLELLRRQPDALPCSRLAIAANEFDESPASGAQAITRFYSAQPQFHPSPSIQQQTPHTQSLMPRQQRQVPRQWMQCWEHEHPSCESQFKCSMQETKQQNREDHQQKQVQGMLGDWLRSGEIETAGEWQETDDVDRNVSSDKSAEEYDEPYGDDNYRPGKTDGRLQHKEQQQQQSFRPCKRLREEHETHVGLTGSSLQDRPRQQSSVASEKPLDKPWPCATSLRCWLGSGNETWRPTHRQGEETWTEAGPEVQESASDGLGNGPGLLVEGAGSGDTAAGTRAKPGGKDTLAAGTATVGRADGVIMDLCDNSGPEGISSGAALDASSSRAVAACSTGMVMNEPKMVLDPHLGPEIDLLSSVDLDEQRRILHELELARLRSLGRPPGLVAGRGSKGAGTGLGLCSGVSRGMGAVGAKGRGRGLVPATQVKGQTRLTSLLQPRPENRK